MNIFIAYTSADDEWVRSLVLLLRANGMQVHAGADDPPAEAHWLNALRERIDAAELVIAVLSPPALRSSVTMFELGAARAACKPILSLLVPPHGQEEEIPKDIIGTHFSRANSPQEAAAAIERHVAEQMAGV